PAREGRAHHRQRGDTGLSVHPPRPRRWWHARHARIGKALQLDGRTVILTAPLVGGRTLQLVTVSPRDATS
ncbi:hypothetical protein KDA82_18425, partial [Streptomyces daliensis]|nr:hypothetical protein [Streptomyces daliensis]